MFYAPLTDADAAALVRLCAGLPLALRIAGAHLAMDAGERDGVAAVGPYIAAMRANRLRLLDTEATEYATDFTTISATLLLSEDRLSDEERVVWRSLSVFKASFDARAAAAVTGASDALLEKFMRRSMLERAGENRHRLHDLAAEYARKHMRGDDELYCVSFIWRTLRTTLRLARRLMHCICEATCNAGLALFDCERAHIDAAYAWLDSCGDDVTTSRQLVSLVDACTYVGNLRFHAREHDIPVRQRQLRAARVLCDRPAEARAVGRLGVAHYDLGETQKALECHEQALAISREIGDRRGRAGIWAT